MECLHVLKSLALIVILVEAINCSPVNVGDLWKQHGGQGDIGELWTSENAGVAKAYGLLPNSSRKWQLKDKAGNTIIPYVLEEDAFDDAETKEIEKAIEAIAKNTCVKFVEKYEERPDLPDLKNEADFLKIKSEEGKGCYANVVGRKAKGGDNGNFINLEKGEASCVSYGVVIHELMHKMGFWHEHNRPDRDDYIEVKWDNIAEGSKMQFCKVGEQDYTGSFKGGQFCKVDEQDYTGGKKEATAKQLKMSKKMNEKELKESRKYSEYEYLSIMHYGVMAFSKDQKSPTMVPKKADEKTMKMIENGHLQAEATPNDYKAICEMYQCKQCMGKPFQPK